MANRDEATLLREEIKVLMSKATDMGLIHTASALDLAIDVIEADAVVTGMVLETQRPCRL